jgi:hypothetical protein
METELPRRVRVQSGTLHVQLGRLIPAQNKRKKKKRKKIGKSIGAMKTIKIERGGADGSILVFQVCVESSEAHFQKPHL